MRSDKKTCLALALLHLDASLAYYLHFWLSVISQDNIFVIV